MKRITTKLAAFALVAPLAVVACGDDTGDNGNGTNGNGTNGNGNGQTNTVVDVAVRNNFTTLVDLVTAADLANDLATAQDITVLAPTNEAFAALDPALVAYLSSPEGAEDLAEVLSYHVLVGNLGSTELAGATADRATLVEGATVQSAAGGTGAGVVFTDAVDRTANVITADVEADNGVVHVIDTVLLPRAIQIPRNVVEVAQDAGNFSALLQTATALGLDATLAMGENLTVFAPTDAAFGALGDLSGVDAGVLTNIILSHVVVGMAGDATEDGLTAAELTEAGQFTAASNITYTFNATEGTLSNGFGETFGLDTNGLDIEATNGIIHTLADVIIPPTILDIAGGNPSFSTLATLVTENASEGIAAALSPNVLAGNQPITVFAPTNDAFTSTLMGNVPPQRRLDQVLQYHVVPGIITSDMLSDGQTLTTVEGSQLTVRITDDGVFLDTETQIGQGNWIPVSDTDIRTLDGVIHVVDGVLIPEAPSLAANAGALGLNTLIDVAGLLGLDAALASPDSELTVFGPTDAAFAAAVPDQATLTFLQNNRILENIVLYHIAPGTFFSGDVLAAASLETLANVNAPVDAQAGTIAGVPLTEELDVESNNGVLHVVPQVLIPPSILEVAAVATQDLTSVVTGFASPAIVQALDPNVLGNGDDPITVFAPIDGSFDGIDPNAIPVDQILSYHVVAGQAFAGGLMNGDTITTVEGSDLTVVIEGQNVFLETETQTGNARIPVVATDIRTSNGVIHLIDGVLIPTPAN